MTENQATQTNSHEEPREIEIKDPVGAGLLAWLIPGLGHLYQGRTAKGILYFLFINLVFVIGLILGSNPEVGWARVVYFDHQQPMERLHFFGQAGIGVAAVPALVQAYRASQDGMQRDQFMYPPLGENDKDRLHDELGRNFDLGTVYTMIAGLLNILVIYDAVSGPVFLIDEKKAKQKSGEEKTEQSKNS